MCQSSKRVAKQGFCQGAKTACPSLANWVSVVATASWRRCLNLTGDVISTKQGFHIIHMLKIWKLRFAKPIFRYDPFFLIFLRKEHVIPVSFLKSQTFPKPLLRLSIKGWSWFIHEQHGGSCAPGLGCHLGYQWTQLARLSSNNHS